MGTPDLAVPPLEALLTSGHTVVGVVSQPDREAGRGREITTPPVARLARERGIPIQQPEKIKGDEFLESMKTLRPDLIVVVAYGRILPKSILDLPPRGCVNLHLSLLPQYRGAAPVQWALIHDEPVTGVTTLRITERLDAGPIYLQKKVAIEPEDNAEILGHRLAVAGASLLRETVEGIADGSLEPTPQDERLVTLAPPLKKEDGQIDWSGKAKSVAARIRGMNPWPGSYTFLDKKMLKIYSAVTAKPKKEAAPGEVIEITGEGILVGCGGGAGLILKELQLEGRKRMAAAEFLKGHPMTPGARLGQ